MKTLKNEKTIQVFCDCYGESLVLERFEEDGDKGFYVSIFMRGIYGAVPLRWGRRFRWIWEILIHGNIWNDFVVLNDEKAKELKEFLDEKLKQ